MFSHLNDIFSTWYYCCWKQFFKNDINFHYLCIPVFTLSEVNIFVTFRLKAYGDRTYFNLMPQKVKSFWANSFSSFFSPLLFPLLDLLFNASFTSIFYPLFTLHPHSFPSNQILQRSLKQRRPPQQMQWRRPPSPRMTKRKSNLKKVESYED